MINIVIPMAGLGSRFANVGYKKPKPFIDVNGKVMIEHVLENLKMKNANFIMIARKEHLEQEKDIIQYLSEKYNAQFIGIDRVTEGACSTVLHAHRLINNEVPLLMANSDQIIDINIEDFVNDAINRKIDGSILTFKNNHPKWSFAKINEEKFVTEVKEKEPISDLATVGIYFFHSGKLFVENALDMIVQNERVNNEFYVCPVYNYAIKRGAKIGVYTIDEKLMHGIGTPEDLNTYLELIKL